MTDKYSKLAQYLIEGSSESQRVGWRRKQKEVLRGEVQWILQSHGINPAVSNTDALLTVMPFVAQYPEAFSVSGERRAGQSAAIMLQERFSSRSSPEKIFDTEMKRWLRSNEALLLNSIMPSLLRYFMANRKKSRKILQLDELIYFLMKWQYRKREFTVKISNHFYYLSVSKENEEKG